MSNVVEFTGATLLDMPPDRVLSAAIGKMDRVVVVGFDKSGNEYFAANFSDAGEAIFHLQRGIWALNKMIDNLTGDQ